jgi:WD40-like Beta Propeller Repeat
MSTHAIRRLRMYLLVTALSGCATLTGAPPTGSADKPSDEDAAAMKAIGAKVKGTIVWSSSRLGNHDLFTMNTDGSHVKAITQGEAVDWFPRFSPDGSKILFCRSKKGWVSERDANDSEKWDLFTVNPDGSDPTKVVDSASWGSWIGPDEIVFVRGKKVLRTKVGSKDEVELMDSEGVAALDGAQLQQPEMSHDGRFLAITLRGAKRETGIWDLQKKTWKQTGLGCQINWTPDGTSIYWVNPTGNGGSEVFRMPIKNGKPPKKIADDDMKFMDVPGRRSHEYFPQLSTDGKWMVWGVTQRGHDHDIADYEVYLWQVGDPLEGAVRLTYHSSNDRWPDIFIPGAAPAPAASGGGASESEAPADDSGGSKAKADAKASEDDREEDDADQPKAKPHKAAHKKRK